MRTWVMPLRSMRKRLMVQLPVDSACSKPWVMVLWLRCFAMSNCATKESNRESAASVSQGGQPARSGWHPSGSLLQPIITNLQLPESLSKLIRLT